MLSYSQTIKCITHLITNNMTQVKVKRKRIYLNKVKVDVEREIKHATKVSRYRYKIYYK